MTVQISIAMCTFNGANFLKAQLDSLSVQTLRPFELVVCDDHSEDDTIAQLKEFAGRARFPVRIFENRPRLGFVRNFFRAARLCEGDWIAFCDQDDVWLPGKLAAAQRAIIQTPRVGVVLQNAFLCRDTLDHDGRVFPNKYRAGFYPPLGHYGFWVWPGFLQTVRAEYFRKVPEDLIRPRSYYPGHSEITHDKWTCVMANSTGGAIVLDEPVALYRRHEAALTGTYDTQSLGERITKSLGVGSEHYQFLAEVACETANYLRKAAPSFDAAMAQDLAAAAVGFEQISRIQSARARLYASTRLSDRIHACIDVLKLGGYFGPAMIAMGWRSAIKDILGAFQSVGTLPGGMR